MSRISLDLIASKGESLISGRRLRKCGACTECCTVLAAESIGKPYNCRCKDLAPKGCGIYQDRPGDCAAYECLWLAGMGTEDDRPDRLGVVFSIRFDERTQLTYIDAHETRPGAFAAVSDMDFQRLLDGVEQTMRPELQENFYGVVLIAHGLPVGTSVEVAPEYAGREPVANGWQLRRVQPGGSIFVYLGPEIDGRLTSGETAEEAYAKALKLIEGVTP